MSDVVGIEKITDRAGTGAPDFTNGFNVAGSDSGISPHAHTESANEPSSPSNGDAWWDSDNDIYKVYMNNEWKDWLGTTAPSITWFGDRAIIWNASSGASSNYGNNIEYFDITTTGNASAFGNQLATTQNVGTGGDRAFSNGSRIVCCIYRTGSDGLEYITSSTLGNATDFGNVQSWESGHTSVSDGTNGYHGAGNGTNSYENEIQKTVIDTLGNAVDSGYDFTSSMRGAGTWGNTARGVFAGDEIAGPSNQITYIAFPLGANAADFGDLTLGRNFPSGGGDTTRAVFSSGWNSNNSSGSRAVNTIDYITIGTTGNATDFGDLNVATSENGSASNATRVCMCNGYYDHSGAGRTDRIDYVTTQTTGNATDFGNMTGAGSQAEGSSGAAS